MKYQNADEVQQKQIEDLVEEWIKVIYQTPRTNQIVLSAVARFMAFMILNHTRGDSEEAMESWKSTGQPIVEMYIENADKWVSRSN